MNAKTKLALLLFGLAIPYLTFVIYFGMHFQHAPAPTWFTNTLMTWFAANFSIFVLFARRLRGPSVPTEEQRALSANWARLGARLILLWVGLFVYVLIMTLQGKIPLNRALPAGAFLLFFIGTFGWNAYRVRHENG